MSEDTRPEESPDLSAAALQEWGQHVEQVLRGVAHALNNRAAAISAIIELANDPEEGDGAVTKSILVTELDRLLDLTKVVRSIGAPRSGMEALAPRDAAGEAMDLLRLYAGLRDVTVQIDAATAPPIRVPRWMFVRALVALAAGTCQGAATKSFRSVVVAEEGEWLVARIAASQPLSGRISPLAAELAAAMGGGPVDQGIGFRVPTLAAVRQREAR